MERSIVRFSCYVLNDCNDFSSVFQESNLDIEEMQEAIILIKVRSCFKIMSDLSKVMDDPKDLNVCRPPRYNHQLCTNFCKAQIYLWWKAIRNSFS